ncbi:MAG TPA: hypothetical protein VME69_06945, partial [Methylocella sp.]|nr:hypothetical protein [Methylocella sp.]
YLSLARNFKYWWRILHGQITIDYIFRRLATLREQRKSLRPHPQHKSEGEILDFLAAQEMGDLLKLRIETFLAYSAGESSIDQYQQSRNMKYANIHIVQFDHADHLFYQRSERRQLMELIRDYLGTLGPLESNKANKPDVNFTICDSSKIELSPFERTGSK